MLLPDTEPIKGPASDITMTRAGMQRGAVLPLGCSPSESASPRSKPSP
jgi:hypothetical protein